MQRIHIAFILLAAMSSALSSLHAEPVPYTNETAFLNALRAEGFTPITESFEDDTAWGSVRSTIIDGNRTAASVTHLGITWTSSSENNNITTGPGPARTGEWGFFSLPHGDYENGIGDGFVGTTTTPLVAIGGWIDSNTPIAKISLFLDGNELKQADFGDDDFLAGPSKFFGVIDIEGFTRFDYRELEGKSEDQKFIFSDDFIFAFGGSIQDCNQNARADVLDISGGFSADCDYNSIPDECEISSTSTAPGGPFFCMESCDPDCNNNGLLDACEVTEPRTYTSGELTPIGNGFPQSFTITSPPPSRGNVRLAFTAHANFGGDPEYLDIDINGVSVGSVFRTSGRDCPEGAPDSAALIVPMQMFNDAVNGGDALITMVPSSEVDHNECNIPSFVALEVMIPVSSDNDIDGDGIPDDCGTLFLRGDCNNDASIDISDPVCILIYLFIEGAQLACEKAADVDDRDGIIITDAVRLLNYLFLNGPPPAMPFPGCGGDPTADDLTCELPVAPEQCR